MFTGQQQALSSCVVMNTKTDFSMLRNNNYHVLKNYSHTHFTWIKFVILISCKGEKWKIWINVMRQRWDNRNWERSTLLSEHTDFLATAWCSQQNRNWCEDTTCCWAWHRGKAQEASHGKKQRPDEVLQVKLLWWIVGTVHCSGVQSLWKDQFIGCKTDSWREWNGKSKLPAEDVACACLCTTILSMPSLQCQLTCGKQVCFKMRLGVNRSIVFKGTQERYSVPYRS